MALALFLIATVAAAAALGWVLSGITNWWGNLLTLLGFAAAIAASFVVTAGDGQKYVAAAVMGYVVAAMTRIVIANLRPYRDRRRAAA